MEGSETTYVADQEPLFRRTRCDLPLPASMIVVEWAVEDRDGVVLAALAELAQSYLQFREAIAKREERTTIAERNIPSPTTTSGLLPVPWTPCQGVMMEPEVWDAAS